MIDQDTQNETSASARRWGTAAALVAAGLAGGVIIAGTVSASASDSTPAPSTSASSGSTAGEGGAPMDPSQPQRSDETLLTGETAEKVTAAALAEYPGATVERVETDSEGVYEAHLITSDGTHVIVAVGEDFTVTGSQEMTGGPHGGRGPGAGSTDPSATPSASSTA